MKVQYFCVTCYTPFVGEENDYFIATSSRKELERFCDECAYDNGSEWFDWETLEANNMTEDEYYSECTYSIEEITEEEYYEACPWDKPKEEK